ncbi:MAG: polysaccharide biosynthesis/export family protein [Planctomycetes bacterium]|nr:polysaccharide biosynthesis/export family protein [Planctomycetota bacterium]
MFPAPADYILGPNDTLQVVVAGLSNPGREERERPILATIMANGKIRLPLVGEVEVSGMNLSQAQKAIDDAYSDGAILVNPKTSVVLEEMGTFNVPILGEVTSPGVHALRRYENDVVNAIALAGGLTPFSAEVIEVHRRMSKGDLASEQSTALPEGELFPAPEVLDQDLLGAPLDAQPNIVIRIPLRGGMPVIVDDNQTMLQMYLSVDEVKLRPGDVIVVPRQTDEVFFVVGLLNRINVVNFRVTELDRQLGNAFLLPKDRDVDVVTAVAMAGYIHPIDSPTTVTVHRSVPGASPMLIHVDLIAARSDWKENVYVQPGDIIYLNPDPAWWMRRTFDRVIPNLITMPYNWATLRWIIPGRFN